jgi:hypothetical protein
MMAVVLPEGYYLSNFTELINHVTDHYWDLLSLPERDFHHNFKSLDQNTQKLYVRMTMRKGTTFRASKLHYKDIQSTATAAQILAEQQFIDTNPKLKLDDSLGLFNKNEWLAIVAANDIDASSLSKVRRQDLNVALKTFFPEYSPTLPGDIYQILHSEVFDTFKLLFFGNLHQDLTEFVLRDLGLYIYEAYNIDNTPRLFQAREHIEQHLTFYRLTNNLDDTLQQTGEAILEAVRALPCPQANDKILARCLRRTYIKMARQLERLNQLEDALIM